MEKIESFKINHLDHPAGIYLSRQDGDIYTYDVRICKPYSDRLMTNGEMHSLEHLLATILRNGSLKDDVIYVGPMGCQTGFYVLMRNVKFEKAEEYIINGFKSVLAYNGDMPGKSKIECGNCRNLVLNKAKTVSAEFLKRIGEKSSLIFLNKVKIFDY